VSGEQIEIANLNRCCKFFSRLQQQGEHRMKKLSTIILILIFLAGLSLLLYPTASDYWNSLHQSRVVADYSSQVADMDDSAYQAALQQARDFNESLVRTQNGGFTLSETEQAVYNSLLDITDSHVMSYVEIPSISCTLPIYHGTDDTVLQVGVGHLEGSSLPVGGESTHTVVVGHRGLPTAKLFTSLDKLVEGDVFMLHTLEETLTYEVDQILIVDPDDTAALAIVPGEDYCTLVTCTPYGVNTHRLLVRGHRVDNLDSDTLRVTADGIQLEPVVVAPFAAVPIFLILLIWILRRGKKRNR
jgi:sortase A